MDSTATQPADARPTADRSPAGGSDPTTAATTAGAAPPVEHRRAKRGGASKQARIHVDAGGGGGYNAPIPAEILDLSLIGIGLVCGREMPRGQRFLLNLLGTGGFETGLLYTVARCVRVA